MAMTYGKMQSLVAFAPACGNLSPHSLSRGLDTVLELTAVKCKRKIARVSLQEFFGKCITMRLKSGLPFFVLVLSVVF